MAQLQYHPKQCSIKAILQVWWIYWINLLSHRVKNDDGNRQTNGQTDKRRWRQQPFGRRGRGLNMKLDLSTARRRLMSPQSLSGTSAYPTMVTLVNIMVMNGWLTSFSFHVDRPSHSWEKAISDFDPGISTPGSRSWVWSKGKLINRPSMIITHLVFISKFDPETSTVNIMSEVKGQGHILLPSIQPMLFLFVSHQSDQPFLRYGQNSVWPWKTYLNF